MLKDLGIDDYEVNSAILGKVIEFCSHHKRTIHLQRQTMMMKTKISEPMTFHHGTLIFWELIKGLYMSWFWLPITWTLIVFYKIRVKLLLIWSKGRLHKKSVRLSTSETIFWSRRGASPQRKHMVHIKSLKWGNKNWKSILQ